MNSGRVDVKYVFLYVSLNHQMFLLPISDIITNITSFTYRHTVNDTWHIWQQLISNVFFIISI